MIYTMVQMEYGMQDRRSAARNGGASGRVSVFQKSFCPILPINNFLKG